LPRHRSQLSLETPSLLDSTYLRDRILLALGKTEWDRFVGTKPAQTRRVLKALLRSHERCATPGKVLRNSLAVSLKLFSVGCPLIDLQAKRLKLKLALWGGEGIGSIRDVGFELRQPDFYAGLRIIEL
jgi:hypothetical protein